MRSIRKIAWTSPKKFKFFCEQFKKTYPNIPIIAIGILPPCVEYEKQAKGISKRILEYNNILLDVFGEYYIDTSDIPNNGIMSDHHHMTASGHLFVYNKIIEHISSIS